jgi:glycosyltransferase involved in cell wall biosynthesis
MPAHAAAPARIALLFLTWNRIEYTRLSLPRLLADPGEAFDLILWDNGSTDGTREYLESIRDPRIRERILRPTNEGQTPAIEHLFRESGAELVGKVDNDCLVTPGWTRTLARALDDVPELGGVGCWTFMAEDFDADLARHKLRRFGEHTVVAHPYLGGSAFLTRRADFTRFGPVSEPGLFPRYWIRAAAAGRVNGWYLPLVLVEHMDDPRSPHCLLREPLDPRELPFALRLRGLSTRQEFARWIREDARAILRASSDVKHHTGWRAAWKRTRRRWRGRAERLAQRLRPRKASDGSG